MTCRSLIQVLAVGCFVAAAGCRKPAGLWAVPAADPRTLRATSLGQVVGGQGRYGSDAWLGIPFAEPPVGPLRWRAPRPPAPWPATRQALTFPAACPQFPSALGGAAGEPGAVVGSEDCLALNIWTPRFATGQVPQAGHRLPVMFWIHGGGNTIGSSSFFDGGHLATDQNVVVVSIQYRLGPLGWFRHRALRAETADPLEQSGNFGTLDQIRALEWVRTDISEFGGDPDNITIFGESAGGVDVFSLLLSPRAAGLFHRAIVESGGLSNTSMDEAEHFTDERPPGPPNSSSEVVLRLLENGGASDAGGAREAAKARLTSRGDAQVAQALRQKTPAELLGGYVGARAAGMIDMPLLIHDGAVLPSGDWLEFLARRGGWNEVPVMVGTNREEAKLFLFMDPQLIHLSCGLFPRFVNEPTYQGAAEALSRMWKAKGADEPCAAMHRSGARSLYEYRFDWHGEPTVFGADLSSMIGAAHGLEIPFVFGHFDLGAAGNQLFDDKGAALRGELSRAMMSYWAAFARAGNPNGSSEFPNWSAFDDSKPGATQFMVLDAPLSRLRMSNELEVPSRIIADVDADARLPTQKDKCAVFRAMTGLGSRLAKADYVHVGAHGCAGYPWEQYPWNDAK